MKIQNYDVAIAGSGPTACVLAKDLAMAGKSVIVMEQGDASRAGIGTMMALSNGKHVESTLPKSMFSRTIEGDDVLIGIGLGGGSKTYGGGAFIPEFDMFRKYDMDIEPYLEAAMQESWVSRRPDRFIGLGTRRMLQASKKLGIPMEITLGHAKWEKCRQGCSSSSFGCKTGAKWEGKYAAEDAMMYGAEFLFNTRVDNTIIEDGKAVGFQMKNLKTKERHEVRAKVVVVACGGRNSVILAKKAGMKEAGSWFTGDPCTITMGFVPKGQEGAVSEPMFSASCTDKEHGLAFAMTGLSFPYYFSTYFLSEPTAAVKDVGKYKRCVQVFNKIHDQDEGWVDEKGVMSKTYTKQDQERLEYGRDMNKKLLVEYGCDPDDIHYQTLMLGHPSGTVKVGPLLDSNLQSKTVPNLYFCDTSTFPEAVGAPPVLTLVCLAKYFSNHLVKEVL